MENQINYIFADLSKDEIEQKISGILDEAVKSKYGNKPDIVITKRVRNEWRAIEQSGLVVAVAALYELALWLKENKIPYWIRACGGSSFVLYMLGITTGNPLPAHLYCPACKTVEFRSAFKDGFDIVEGLECDHDGTKRIADGHNIPWQTMWGYGEYQASLDVDLPKELYEPFQKMLSEHWLVKMDAENYPHNPHKDIVDCLKLSNISLMFVLDSEEISKNFYSKEFTAADWEYIMNKWDLLVQYESDCELNIPTPTYFSDLVAMSGLLHSTGVWDEAAEFMVFELSYSLSDMIAFRDDVYSYLIDHYFLEKDAWRGMNRVRKGLGLPTVTDEMLNARDQWVLHRCHAAKYLFPKAHAVEYIFFKLKADQ